MPDYQKGKIYKIWDSGYNECYVGSTCDRLSQRMADHRRKYKEFQQGKFQLIASFEPFERYGVENCRIELEEMFPCNNKEELLSREGYYIKNSECINKRVAGRTYDDYKHDNRALIQSINSKHYYKNKEKILNKRKEHITCGCDSSIRRSDKKTRKIVKAPRIPKLFQQPRTTKSDLTLTILLLFSYQIEII